MKASFFKRLGAYIIDVLFITMIGSIIASGMNSASYEKSYKEYEKIIKDYSQGEIKVNEYVEKIGPLTYDLQKSSVNTTIFLLVLSSGYFVVFQYLNKGQTLGKKIFKIRVGENGNVPSVKAIILRTFFVNSIFTSLMSLVLVYSLDRNNFYKVFSVISSIESLFIFISALFVLYRKDKRGLHDIIAHTEVIDCMEERGN